MISGRIELIRLNLINITNEIWDDSLPWVDPDIYGVGRDICLRYIKTQVVWMVAVTNSPSSISKQHIFKLKLVCAVFYQFLFFRQVIALRKLWKMFFISSKRLFSFPRYSNFCNFSSSFPHFPDSKGQMEVE